MGGEGRPAAHPLTDALRERPWDFDFFQAVRRIECLRAGPPLGSSPRLADDPVRFGQNTSLGFAPAPIAECPTPPGRPQTIRVNFFGLLGPNGPMPMHLTEYARDRIINAGDPTLARFLDIFHHRMIALFYRAWAANQKAVSYERHEADRFAVYVASLCGLGMPSLRDRDAVPDTGKLFHSGPLAGQTRHAAGLRSLLEQYFGVPATIIEFVGRWMELPDDSRCRLGKRSGRLGSTAIVGARIWECQQRFRVRFGPMTLAQFERLLPGGPSQKRLAAWITNYIGQELEWDTQLVLRASEVPRVELGRAGKLGWSTWVGSEPVTRDRGDLVVSPRLN
ncbi:MAG: type VI secretion system baseplate subunit TssG [Phycisphaerales bacterium]